MALRGPILAYLLLPSVFGCGRFVYQPTQQPNPQAAALAPQQQVQVAQQQLQFQQRAQALDRDNQELESLLAQARQQQQLLQEETNATRSQLRTMNEQLLAMRTENEQLRSKTSAIAASVRNRTDASIRANNSLLQNLTIGEMPGIDVRQDGDVIRVEIPEEQLFLPGSPYLKKGAESLLHTIAAELHRAYPDNFIGIEGHTDNSPPRTQQYPSSHHLAVGRALAVFAALVSNRSMPPNQVFVIGHGSNHPIVSNATPAGQARNRRVELVVYPETLSRR